MKNRIIKSLTIATCLSAVAPATQASMWGCEVLLCLSNPAGPMAVSQCVPPITKLYNALKKPKPDPFPTCAMASGPKGKSWAEPGSSYYDPCPSGTTPLPDGSFAVSGVPAGGIHAYQKKQIPFATGIGDGDGLYPSYDNPLKPKVCVAGYSGTTTVLDKNSDPVQVGIYQQVILQDPAATPSLIKVYIDNALFRTVRY